MSKTTLMKPLFVDGRFNADGRRMKAIFCCEISDGTYLYRLWQRDGQPDVSYPRGENDTHYLYVELNGYLAPLGKTEFELREDSGLAAACELLYGGRTERREYLSSLSKSAEYGPDAVQAAIAREKEEILRLGIDPVCQAGYVTAWLTEKIETYQAAKANGGSTFPNYIGALALNELEQCRALFAVYRAKKEEEARQRMEQAQLEREQKGLEVNRESEQIVAEAEKVLLTGGTIENKKIRFYESGVGFKTTCLVNYLMQKYGVNVPLRTRGWIINNLTRVTLDGAYSTQISYLRPVKSRTQGSAKIYDCIHELRAALKKRNQIDDAPSISTL